MQVLGLLESSWVGVLATAAAAGKPAGSFFQLNPWVISGLVVLFVLVSFVLMLTILIQKPQGGGLAGAFGSGAGSGQTAFGAKTGDALTIATISMFALWVVFGVGLNFALTPAHETAAKTTAGTNNQVPPADGTTPAPADESAPATGENKPADGGAPPAGGTPAEKPADPAPVDPPVTTPPAPPAEKPAEPQTPPANTPPM